MAEEEKKEGEEKKEEAKEEAPKEEEKKEEAKEEEAPKEEKKEEEKKEEAAPAAEASKEQIEEGKLMAILAYIFCLIIVPYLTAKENPYVWYHIKMAVVLGILFIPFFILAMIFLFVLPLPILSIIFLIPLLCIIVLWLLCLLNAANGKMCGPHPAINPYLEKLTLDKIMNMKF